MSSLFERTTYAVQHSEVYYMQHFHMAWQNQNLKRLMGNELTFPPSEKVIQAITEIAGKANYYPEDIITNEDLRTKIAAYVGGPIQAQNITVGNGSLELIDMIYKVFLCAGDEVLLPSPEYSAYAKWVPMHAASLVDVLPDDKHFSYSAGSFLRLITKHTKLIIAASPNNPVGYSLSREIVKALCDTGIIIVIDEAYGEFARTSVSDLVASYPNLIVTRTLSKAIGLAGIRFGYCIADPEVIEYINRVRVGVNNSVLTLAAVNAILDDPQYIQENVKRVIENRTFLFNEIEKIPGLEPYPSTANYILINCAKTGISGTDFYEQLLSKGYITRKFTNSRGFTGDDHFRITIGTRPEMEGILTEIKILVND